MALLARRAIRAPQKSNDQLATHNRAQNGGKEQRPASRQRTIVIKTCPVSSDGAAVTKSPAGTAQMCTATPTRAVTTADARFDDDRAAAVDENAMTAAVDETTG